MQLVSCVMPTRGRGEWARLAVECFLAQDYPAKELIILDDADDPSFPEDFGANSPFLYNRIPERLAIPEKRNRINALAGGELIAHWDSDDWSAPTRLSHQVALLGAKALTGFNTLLFYEPSTGSVARYIGKREYACGTSMLYRKSFWSKHPFRRQKFPRNLDYGSDNVFGNDAREAKQLVACDGGRLMVARVHPGNTNDTRMYKMNEQLTVADLPEGFPR